MKIFCIFNFLRSEFSPLRVDPFWKSYFIQESKQSQKLFPFVKMVEKYGHVSYTFNTTKLVTVKILKIGTPEIITIIVLQLEQLDFTVQYCVQKMQTE